MNKQDSLNAVEKINQVIQEQQRVIDDYFQKIDTKNKLIRDLQKQIHELSKELAKKEDMIDEQNKQIKDLEYQLEIHWYDEETYKLSDIAAELGISSRGLATFLKSKGIMERVNGVNQLTAPYRDKGYEVLANGKEPAYFETTQKVYTAAGAKFIFNTYKGSEGDDF
jgi:predicted nuclease with TOPRIM domain